MESPSRISVCRHSAHEASKVCNGYISDLEKFQESLPKPLQEHTGSTFIMTYRDLYDKLPKELNVKNELEARYIRHHSK